MIQRSEGHMNYSDKKLKYFSEDSHIRKSELDRYLEMVNDHEETESLMALDVHQDTFHPTELSRVHRDEELEKSIRELLQTTKKIDGGDITVSVSNSDVKLSGSVKSQFDRDYAISLVKLIHGVGNIKAEIIVKINPGILPTDIGRNP
jgi:osmotically-inducible protein OsmY